MTSATDYVAAAGDDGDQPVRPGTPKKRPRQDPRRDRTAEGRAAAKGLQRRAAAYREITGWKEQRRRAKHARVLPKAQAQGIVRASAREEVTARRTHLTTVTVVYPRVGKLGTGATYSTTGTLEYGAIKSLFGAYNVGITEARLLPFALTAAVALATAWGIKLFLTARDCGDELAAAKKKISRWTVPAMVIGASALVVGMAVIGGTGIAPAASMPEWVEPAAAMALVGGMLMLSISVSVSFTAFSYTANSADYVTAVRELRRVERRVTYLSIVQRAYAKERKLAELIRNDVRRAKLAGRVGVLSGLTELFDSASEATVVDEAVQALCAEALDGDELDRLLDTDLHDPGLDDE